MKNLSSFVCVLVCFVVAPCVAQPWLRYDGDFIDIVERNNSNNSSCSITIRGPLQTNMVLTSVMFNITAIFPPFFSGNLVIPDYIHYWVWSNGSKMDAVQGVFSHENEMGPTFSLRIPISINSSGFHDVHILFMYLDKDNVPTQLCSKQTVFLVTWVKKKSVVEGDRPYVVTKSKMALYSTIRVAMNIRGNMMPRGRLLWFHKNFLAVPGALTLAPPILTAVIAVIFRQVIIALLLGIWTCALLANRYNPLLATLRTLDTYFVDSVADVDHAAIAVFSFFLGGLIGVIQKSGGGLGLAALLKRLTGSRRRASLACIILGSLIFFDDYSLVLITGTSLRTMVKNAGMSKEKFAYILKSIAPTLPSIVPVSSWIGVQVGYLQTALKSQFCQECAELKNADAFVVTINTIPYRFFPLLLIFSVIFIALLDRDFGPLLTAERNVVKLSQVVQSPESIGKDNIENKGRRRKVLHVDHVEESFDEGYENNDVEMNGSTHTGNEKDDLDVIYTGPLAPKKGIKYRWYNAAIPFLVVIVFTLLGMVLGGYVTIKRLSPDERVEVNIINIFTYANSINSLIWSSALACVVTMAMLLISRTLSLQEYMDSWIEGVKDLIEPFMILWLAWGLGQALEDIQATNFLAQALEDGGMKADYIPAIVTLIGFIMSFAAGSAFGTMGIIIPLVIPTICKISNCSYDAVLQSSAAILASSLFGNDIILPIKKFIADRMISPIAGICILTVFATECGLAPHIKSAALYTMIIAVVSVLFGALPVGAGWYPWYVGWFVMAAIMVAIFILFSSSPDSPTSRPLLKRICPWAYSVPCSVLAHVRLWFFRKCQQVRCCTCYRTNCGKKKTAGEESPLLA